MSQFLRAGCLHVSSCKSLMRTPSAITSRPLYVGRHCLKAKTVKENTVVEVLGDNTGSPNGKVLIESPSMHSREASKLATKKSREDKRKEQYLRHVHFAAQTETSENESTSPPVRLQRMRDVLREKYSLASSSPHRANTDAADIGNQDNSGIDFFGIQEDVHDTARTLDDDAQIPRPPVDELFAKYPFAKPAQVGTTPPKPDQPIEEKKSILKTYFGSVRVDSAGHGKSGKLSPADATVHFQQEGKHKHKLEYDGDKIKEPSLPAIGHRDISPDELSHGEPTNLSRTAGELELGPERESEEELGYRHSSVKEQIVNASYVSGVCPEDTDHVISEEEQKRTWNTAEKRSYGGSQEMISTDLNKNDSMNQNHKHTEKLIDQRHAVRKREPFFAQQKADPTSEFSVEYKESPPRTIVNETASLQGVKPQPSPNKRGPFNSVNDQVADMHHPSDETVYSDTLTRRQKSKLIQPVANLNDPQTAYDMAMKIRLERKTKQSTTATTSDTGLAVTNQSSQPEQTDDVAVRDPAPAPRMPRGRKWLGKVDSFGFRILTDQVQNLNFEPEDFVVKLLRDSVLFENDDVLAIDKPYGLASHGGPGVHHSVGGLLQPLAQKLKHSGELHLVHRLDKETTGVLLLAKTTDGYWRARDMFKKRQVIKKYLAITKNVPKPLEGVINIPMAEVMVQGKERMDIKPDYPENLRVLVKQARSDNRRRFQAVTEYKVLDRASGAALVECHPQTGVKHQIRCHLAFGLYTPILGDHKYSHFTRIAPQKLNTEMLKSLHVRQAKVRHIPMHLHASTLILPEFVDGKNLFLSARLPNHFMQNLKWLELKLPKK